MNILNNMNSRKKNSSLEETKKKLYSAHYKPNNPRAKLSNKKYNLESSWDDENDVDIENFDSHDDYWGPHANKEKTTEKSNNFLFVLVFAALFFVGSLVYAFYTFNIRNTSGGESSVVLSVMGPVSIGGGETLSMDVIIQNNHSVPLTLVDLVIDYPAGTKYSNDLTRDLRRDRIPLADIEPGSVTRRNITSTLFGDENTVQDITVTLEYRLKGSSAIFSKKSNFGITLSASPVRLVVEGLREISSGQELELIATVSSNSTNELRDVMLIANYPFGFTFEESSVGTYMDNNIWLFNRLKPEEKKEIIIKGKIHGQDNEDRIFRFSTGIKNEEVRDEIGIMWGTTFHETKIQNSFANLAIELNGSYANNVTAKSGEMVDARIFFYNNTDETLRNIRLEIQFEGDVLNKRTVQATDGFYSSSQNMVFWDKETNSRFQSLAPRGKIEVTLRFAPIDLSTGNIQIENPKIVLNAKSEAIRISANNVEEKVINRTPAEIAVLSDVGAKIYTAYGNNPLNNFGPIPPKADQETTYTVVMEVSNGNNDLKNAKFVTTFPSYVKWERVANPEGSSISYNENTRQLTWNIGDIESGVGFQTEPKKLYLSVTLKPSLSQIGRSVNLTSHTRMQAFDTYANENITINLIDATTRIFNRTNQDNHASVVE